MIDKNKPNKAAADERIKTPKKVNKQTKEIAESSDDEDPRRGLARDRQPKPMKSDELGKQT